MTQTAEREIRLEKRGPCYELKLGRLQAWNLTEREGNRSRIVLQINLNQVVIERQIRGGTNCTYEIQFGTK